MGKVIFISPHLDDAIFSCAGLIQDFVQKLHEVTIVTVFSQDANERIAEDLRATQTLGCHSQLLNFQDAPIRRGSSDVLFQNISSDTETIEDLIEAFTHLRNKSPAATRFFAPLAVGWHVDHLITFEAAIKAFPNSNLEFYEDAPYRAVKYQTDLRIGSENESHRADFVQDFFNAKYVKTYLSDWTPELLAEKMKDYSHYSVPLPIHQSRELIVNDSMMKRSQIAKSQYSSQSVFYDPQTEGTLERYYQALPGKKATFD